MAEDGFEAVMSFRLVVVQEQILLLYTSRSS